MSRSACFAADDLNRDDLVFLDHQSTTPLAPEVLDAMLPFLQEQHANPSSMTHAAGHRESAAVRNARGVIADFLGANEREIIFTSGATESNNLAIRGVMTHEQNERRVIITSAVEHSSVMDTIKSLYRDGYAGTFLPVDRNGLVNANEFREFIQPDTAMASVMFANNETGVIQDIPRLAAIARDKGVLFHCDAAQGMTTHTLRVDQLPIDLLSLSAHKMYGPKGIGVLYARGRDPRVRLNPQIHGGDQERGRRAGTLSPALIVGMATACQLASQRIEQQRRHLLRLRGHLLERLSEALPDIRTNGSLEERLCGNINLLLPEGCDALDVLEKLPRFCLSTGSACTSAVPEPSHVLLAMGLSAAEADRSIRIGLGHDTTRDELDAFMDELSRVISTAA